MSLLKIAIGAFLVFSFFSPVSMAADFDWMKDFSLKAEADPSGFKAKLCTRFKIGDAEFNAVISNVDTSADAYMVLRLGEMAEKPTDEVIKKYKSGKGQGWGSLAKSLGIKPGSQEFHDLKQGDDLYGPKGEDKKKGKDKGKKKKK